MDLKLYMLLLGCRPAGRHVEQHDYFFAIAAGLPELKPMIRSFWPEAVNVHIDAWREVTSVEGYQVKVELKSNMVTTNGPRLFFINLGGYQQGKFEEQHYSLLTVKAQKAEAFREAKQTVFYRHNFFGNATSHIDDRYGIDVDDLYEIQDILPLEQRGSYSICLEEAANLADDELHLGYLKLSAIK